MTRRLVDVGLPPSWIDPSQLRACLDSLRGALAPTIVPLSFAWTQDRDRVAIQLRAIVKRLRELDVGTRHALVPMAAAFTRSAEQDRLAPTLKAVHDALARRVQAVLGPRKLDLLRELLAESVPSLLDLFNRADSENAHSDVIAWFLNPQTAPRIAPVALAGLTTVLEDPHAWAQAVEWASGQGCLSVRREFVIGREWTGGNELDRIDLVISGPGFVLAIENKMWAPEHQGQTTAYWHWLETLPERHAGLFLTPTGRYASATGFTPLSYLELLSFLLEAPSRGDVTSEERIVLAAYAKTLQRHVLRSEFHALAMSGGRS